MKEAYSGLTSAERLSLFGAIARHKWLVLFALVGSIGIGLALDQTVGGEYEATAELIVEDPRSATLLSITASGQPNNIASERFLADQVAMLESNEAAQLASQALGDRMSSQSILEQREIVGSATSNLIEVRFQADQAQEAKEGADALVEAYLELRRSQARATADVALSRLSALQDALDRELEDLQRSIDRVLADDSARQELLSQIDEAVIRLNELRSRRDAESPGSEQREILNAQIDELARDFAAWEIALRMERQNPTLELHQAEQDAAIAEKADLTALRNSIAVESEIAAGGVTLASPAQLPTTPSGISRTVLLAAFAVAGLAGASAIAYYLSLRRRILTGKYMPEEVLEVPLLGEVPDTTEAIPLPDTPTAEAFRFIAAGVGVRASSSNANLVVFTSPEHGAGTTRTVINTAIALAESGSQVAIVDADFTNQSLSRAVGLPEAAGMAEVVAGDVFVRDVIREITSSNAGTISILQPGSSSLGSVGLLSTDAASQFLHGLSLKYDLVLIDAPPILEVAYTTNLAGHADAAVIVVREGSSLDSVQEAGGRLKFLGTPILGYVYTHGSPQAGRSRKQTSRAASAIDESPPRSGEDTTVFEESVSVPPQTR